MAFTRRAAVAEKITELIDAWYSDGSISPNTGLGTFIAEGLLADGMIAPEITEAESDGIVASILAIE